MDPAIHECVLVVVCVCRLGEEYMRGCGLYVCGYLGEAD